MQKFRIAVELREHGRSGVLHDGGGIADVRDNILLCEIGLFQTPFFDVLINEQKNEGYQKQAEN